MTIRYADEQDPGRMTADNYLKMLRARISEEEREELESGGDLVIGSYNRATMLRMLRDTETREKTVDIALADALENALRSYLDRYMADMPRGHKWVILSCLYLAMVAGEPMHPQAITGWRREGDRYYCRAREDTPDSTCRWCVCRPYSELSGPEL